MVWYLPPSLGNVAVVDSTNGSDTAGGVGAHSYRTVEAALAAVSSGHVVLVLPGTHTLSAGLTMPAGVCMMGLSEDKTILALTATASTTMVTMSADSIICGMTLSLSAAGHVDMTAVSIAGSVAETAKLEGVDIDVDNDGGADGGTSAVYGIHVSGAGSPSHHFTALEDVHVSVSSAGLGDKRALLVNGANGIIGSNCDFSVHRTGAGAGSYIAVETNHANASCEVVSSHIDCSVTADISQTLGTLRLGATKLVNNTSNAKGFATVHQCPLVIWGETTAPGAGTKYLRFGSGAAAASEPKATLRSPCIVKNMAVHASVGPGAARTDTLTIRKNGVDTALSVSLTAAATENLTEADAVSFAVGDDISCKLVAAGGSTIEDCIVSVELY